MSPVLRYLHVSDENAQHADDPRASLITTQGKPSELSWPSFGDVAEI